MNERKGMNKKRKMKAENERTKKGRNKARTQKEE